MPLDVFRRRMVFGIAPDILLAFWLVDACGASKAQRHQSSMSWAPAPRPPLPPRPPHPLTNVIDLEVGRELELVPIGLAEAVRHGQVHDDVHWLGGDLRG